MEPICTNFELKAQVPGLAAYDAVRAGVPIFRTCLDDPSAKVRSRAIYALAWLAEEAEADAVLGGSMASLEQVLDSEKDAAVLASAIISLGLLNCRCGAIPVQLTRGEERFVNRLRGYSTDSRPLVRWAAAVALTRLGREEENNIIELTRCLRDCSYISGDGGESNEAAIPFYSGNLIDYSAAALGRLKASDNPEAANAVLVALSRTSGTNSFIPARVALCMAFGCDPPSTDLPPFEQLALSMAFGCGPLTTDLPAFEQLDQFQRQAVQVLAEMDKYTWSWNNFLDILRRWNIPSDRDDCRRYAGLSAEGLQS